jgi:hypothetical protein
MYMCACLISGTQNYVYKYLVTLLGKSLPLITSLQQRISNISTSQWKPGRTWPQLLLPKTTRLLIQVIWYSVKDSPTSSLKKIHHWVIWENAVDSQPNRDNEYTKRKRARYSKIEIISNSTSKFKWGTWLFIDPQGDYFDN